MVSHSEPKTLRPYQEEAIVAVDREHRRVRSTLLVLPTGAGKTVVFARLAQRRWQQSGHATLVLVHRDELAVQAAAKCGEEGLWVEREQGPERASLGSSVVVASVQTLSREPRLARWPRDHFGLVVVDEAHHAVASGYRRILEHFAAAKVLGVTATPLRGDGRGLDEVFSSIAYRLEIRQAIQDKWLVPIRAQRVLVDGLELGQIRTRAGDLASDELALALRQERAVQGVVRPTLELAGERRTVVFSVDVAHAHDLASELNRRRPGCARAVSGDDSLDDRQRTLLAFARRREFQFLVNCALLTEGWDEPSVECVVLARPTKSWALFVQCVGRGLRLSPATRKRDLLLLAFSGDAGKHRLVSPGELLVGELAEDVRGELDRLLGAGVARPLDQAIADATLLAETARGKARRDLKLRWRLDAIDVFVGPDEQPPLSTRPGWVDPLATPAQLGALHALGVETSQVASSLTQGEAWRLIARLRQRQAKGLCSLKAARVLARSGIDTRELSAERARELLAILSAGGWRPHALYGQPEVPKKATGLPQDVG